MQIGMHYFFNVLMFCFKIISGWSRKVISLSEFVWMFLKSNLPEVNEVYRFDYSGKYIYIVSFSDKSARVSKN